MKRAWMALVVLLLAHGAVAEVGIRQVDLEGRISKEELALRLRFEAEVDDAPARMLVLDGMVLPTEMKLPRGAQLILEEGAYYLEFEKNGRQEVSIDFEAKVFSSGQKRATVFGVPAAAVRQMVVETADADCSVEVADAPKTERLDDRHLRIFLPPTGALRVGWRPELEKLSGELVATCESTLVGSAKVGALLLQGRFDYAIPQGRMKGISLALPDGLNIIQVVGEDVLSWDVRGEAGDRHLAVELSRPQEGRYLLALQAELPLADFPCSFSFPVIEPEGVIRANGVVLVGTDSTLKLLVDDLGGLTQVEPASLSVGDLPLPQRGLYAYMFANMPFSLSLSADNIVTSLHAQDQLVLAFGDNEASLDARVDLEVRDAPVRDVEVEVPLDWTVTAAEGGNVADYDVRDRDGSRWIRIYFKQAIENRTLLQLRLERTLAEGATGFRMPRFRVASAKSERGFLVLRGETGTRVEGLELSGLREVNTGSLPVQIVDARQAFRFKGPEWSGRVGIRQEMASIHAESFQLVSLGESGVFGSFLVTYNIANAPVRSFALRIPEGCRNIEFNGRDIRNWTQDGDEWTVRLQQKVIGDYTLLVTYDHPARYQGEELLVGGIRALDIENETGYIALAGAANLSVAGEIGHSGAIYPIDVDEIPEAYALLVNDPVMHAYKYGAGPHEARVRIRRFDTQPLLTQVADHTTIETTIGKDGEAVTLATYHVKNTDRQYLPLRLPEGAALWSVKVEEAKVQVLDKGDGEVLVPVERRRDPNAPLKVEVTYAQQFREPGLASRMVFETPRIETQAVFARWNFRLPDGYRLAGAKGNMEPPRELVRRNGGWGDLLPAVGVGMAGPWLVAGGLLALVLSLMGRLSATRRAGSLGMVLLGLFGLADVAVMGIMMAAVAADGLGAQHGAVSEWTFSKSVAGFGGDLVVKLALAGAGYETAKAWLLGVVGLLPALWSIATRRWRWLFPALAFAVLLCSFSARLAWVVGMAPQLLLFVLCFMVGRWTGRERAADRGGRKMPAFDGRMPADGSDGSAQIKLMGLILAALALAAAGCASLGGNSGGEEGKAIVANRLALSVEVPPFETETAVNVAVHMAMELEADGAGTFQLLGPGQTLKAFTLSSKRLDLAVGEGGCVLRIDRRGRYDVALDCLAEAHYRDGAWSTELWLPEALLNRATVTLPVAGWNVASAEAIRVRQAGAQAEILFASKDRRCSLVWKPEERKTDEEQARFYCDVNTLADFRPGSVDLRHDLLFNIAQGELRNLSFDVPEGMSITEVRGEHVATWRYDPGSRLLEVLLSSPASGNCHLGIGAQIACGKLPYSATIEGLAVHGAAMQRGVVAIACADSVQVDIESTEELGGINVDDAARLLQAGHGGAIKRAFRYGRLPFAARVSADAVLPELRLVEESNLDIAAEQLRLTSRLSVGVGKSGIFALRIRIPDGFDIDTLGGEAVSHWDEVVTGQREVVVNFKRQVLGTVPLNLVLSRSGRDLERDLTMPRIGVDGALKHVGTMAVTVERGIRVTTVQRDGASELNPRELGVRQEGSLAYRLLRPDWTVQLHAEVMAPQVKAEVLQRIALAEGQLKVRCHLQYEIEHAGVKAFRLRTPDPSVALEVSGRNIARVRKVDENEGIWEVELHGKVEERYGMEVMYQTPFDHAGSGLSIRPVETLGTEGQKGYVVVLSGGRLQVEPEAVPDSLRPEDARSIPRRFGAGDLSAAVLCYRATEGDYELKLRVVRHAAAEVLPAQVRFVRLDSLVARDGCTLDSMVMTLDPGSLRFLEMRLPEGAEIWSVFVNETAVRPLVEGDRYLVPIEPGADRSALVEVFYAHSRTDGAFGRAYRLEGPRFALPLRDIAWTVYAPEGYRYSGFAGTMEYQAEDDGRSWTVLRPYSEAEYISYNTDTAQRFGESAKQSLLAGNDYMQGGDQRSARKALRKAISYSQGQQDLNEDARIQYRNLVRQQGLLGLVDRRNQLRQTLNLSTDNLEAQAGGTVQQVEAVLGEKESSALGGLAERMLDQQQAASVEVHPIRVVMAGQGTELGFNRTLQLQPDAEMAVAFHASPLRGGRGARTFVVAGSIGLILLAGGAVARLRRP